MTIEALPLKTFDFQTTETKSFTTSRSNLHNSPVKRRCLAFVDAMRALRYTTLPLEEAKELFQTTLGIMDKASLNAYFGTQPHRSVQHIERMARYPSGTMSLKTIELTHKVGYRAGYLELFWFATIQKKGSTFFIVLNDVGVVPQLVSESLMKDYVGKSNVGLSLSPLSINEQGKGKQLLNDSRETDREERESIGLEREIHFGLSESEKPVSQICPELQLQLLATPTREPVRKCVQCGQIDESNPYRIWCPKGGGERSKTDVCIVEAT